MRSQADRSRVGRPDHHRSSVFARATAQLVVFIKQAFTRLTSKSRWTSISSGYFSSSLVSSDRAWTSTLRSSSSFACRASVSRRLARWMSRRHCPHSQRCDRVETEVTAVESHPHSSVEKYRHECGRMPCSPSNKRGPLRGVQFRRLEYGQVLAWQFRSRQRSRITRR